MGLLGFSSFVQGERLYTILFGKNIFLDKSVFHFHFASHVHAVLLLNITQIVPSFVYVRALTASSQPQVALVHCKSVVNLAMFF